MPREPAAAAAGAHGASTLALRRRPRPRQLPRSRHATPPPCSLQFGGSSVASAERMMEVADIVCSFPEHLPCVVLSAMGKVRCRQLSRPVPLVHAPARLQGWTEM